jgi:NAD(P)-dependent dehydrogenase (short-subunit alcohol dehydrogenase family)
MPKQDKDQLLLSTNPLTAAAPRIGNVDDIAPVVSFLASDGARWVTGTTINVNGGRTFF